jgi:hypothetical protein
MILVTPKAASKCELLFNKLARGGFVEHLILTLVAQQSVTTIISMIIMTLVAPNAGAKHELLFHKPATEVGLMNI